MSVAILAQAILAQAILAQVKYWPQGIWAQSILAQSYFGSSHFWLERHDELSRLADHITGPNKIRNFLLETADTIFSPPGLGGRNGNF